MTPPHTSASPRPAGHPSLATVLLAAALALAACNPREWKTPNMTPPSPRLQALFDNPQTLCFGRFLIDVPRGTKVAWGRAEVPTRVYVYPGHADKLASIVSKKEAELKAEERYPAGEGLFLYERTVLGPREGQATIVSYENFSSPGRQLDSYFPLGGHLFQVYDLSFKDKVPQTIAELQEFSQRLRVRAPEEIPSDPGVCIDHAFRADRPDRINQYEEVEHVRVGFRMPGEHDDIHLSIYVAPANTHDTSGDSLKRQLDRNRADQSIAGSLKNPKIFREAERSIHDWTTGYEILTRSLKDETASSYHDFWLKFTGAPQGDVMRPYADIQMQSGVKDNQAGAAEPSLTDDEAIALWDRITGSIRVRPTGTAAPRKTSEAGPPAAPTGPLLAATGEPCPASGLWQCEDHGNVQRLHVRTGQAMPKASLPAPRSAWQKLRGQASPSYSLNVVWTLVRPDGQGAGDAPNGAAPADS